MHVSPVEVGRLDEESRLLLGKIVEGQAWRQLLLIHARGHGLKLVPDLGYKKRVVGDLEQSLLHFETLHSLYRDLGGGDVISAVRVKLGRFPFPNTRLELAICLFLGDRASRASLEAYRESISLEFGAFARERLDAIRPVESPEDDVFSEFCADPTNRVPAQEMFNRWLSMSLLSLGRPDSSGDARAVALKLRSEHCADSARELLDGLRRFVDVCGLGMPDAETLGVELPGDPRAHLDPR